MEQKLNTSCTKPNCNCIEIAEQKNGGNPVKSYECLSPYPIDLAKREFKKQSEVTEMTNEEKVKAYYTQFVAEKGHEPMPFEFAAFCLDKREKEEFKAVSEISERLLFTTNYMADPNKMLPTEFVMWYSGMSMEKLLKAYERFSKENL